MDVTRQIAYWRQGSDEDFETALILLEKGRVRHALFFAELALEKMLKAHVAKTRKEVPPRTHNLMRLVELAQLSLAEDQRDFISRFQIFCLEGRYPESLAVVPELADAAARLEQCRRLVEWLKTRFGA